MVSQMYRFNDFIEVLMNFIFCFHNLISIETIDNSMRYQHGLTILFFYMNVQDIFLPILYIFCGAKLFNCIVYEVLSIGGLNSS